MFIPNGIILNGWQKLPKSMSAFNEYEVVWEPVTGCIKESIGCDYCWIESTSTRLKEIGLPIYKNGFRLTTHENELKKIEYFSNKKAVIYPCRHSELFHPNIPDDFIKKTLNQISRLPNHNFGICTKHSHRLLDYKIPPNLFLGVTVENKDHYFRIEHLRNTKACFKALLLMPLLGPMPDLPLDGIDWVQIIDERGPDARPCDPHWVYEIAKQCERAGVAVINLYKAINITVPDYYRSALAFQLIEPTNGLLALPTPHHPRAQEYLNLCAKIRHLSDAELMAMVRQAAPDFFEL